MLLLLVTSLKLVAEIALLSLVGQFVLGLLAGDKRENNLVYRVFLVLTGPFVRLTRWVTPRVVLDRHVPLAAFAWLLMAWVVATLVKVDICLGLGVEACR
jgi:hypothetical protein